MYCMCSSGADQGFWKGGASTSSEGASFLGGLAACPPPPPKKFLKICISKMAISSILRQISYSFNANFCYSKLRFCKKSKKEGEGGGEEQVPLDSATAP